MIGARWRAPRTRRYFHPRVARWRIVAVVAWLCRIVRVNLDDGVITHTAKFDFK